MLKPEEEIQLICPWCYAAISVEAEEEEPFTCPVCKRSVSQEDMENEEEKE